MEISFNTLYLKKRFPLAISRGVHQGSENLFICIDHDGIQGWGEMSPGKTEGANTAASAQTMIQDFFKQGLEHRSIQEVYDQGRAEGIAACALAGLDIALWDWLGKKANMPLYQLLGFGKPTVATSVTIGINPPEVVAERVPLLLDGTGIRSLKIKLGSPEGIEADQAMYQQVIESTRGYDVKLRVDANGGWDVDQAIFMMKWLAERHTDYVEQPLKEGQEAELPRLFKQRPLPIYVDESCRYEQDVPKWADAVDGINIKLMKCGGITGALRLMSVAKAFGLKTMIGCMGESSMSISAGAALTGALDHVDLDSHLNLAPDPCTGATLSNGIMMPTDAPGHGAYINH